MNKNEFSSIKELLVTACILLFSTVSLLTLILLYPKWLLLLMVIIGAVWILGFYLILLAIFFTDLAVCIGIIKF